MATVPSVKIVKQSTYKSGSRFWSNRFYFNGGTPSSGSNWDALFDAIVALEKAIYEPTHVIVEAVGYAAGSDVPVRTKTYSTAGTGSFGGENVPLFNAVLGRFSTAARTSKNHPIYLFKYFHGARVVSTGTEYDLVDSSQKSAVDSYLGSWVSGIAGGGVTAIAASPRGAAATGHLVDEFVTHRDFPYQSSL
jgi:hypothetical protein